MSFGNHWETSLLDHAFNLTAYTAPTSLWVGLHYGTALNSDSATVNEVSTVDTDYDRQEYSDWTRTGSTVTNSTDIEFEVALIDWTTDPDEITSIVIYDQETGGNLVAWGTVTTSKPIQEDDQAKILAGQISISLD